MILTYPAKSNVLAGLLLANEMPAKAFIPLLSNISLDSANALAGAFDWPECFGLTFVPSSTRRDQNNPSITTSNLCNRY